MKNNWSKHIAASAITVALMMGGLQQSWALESDRNQPADIEADDTNIDFKTGQRVFTGNVIVVQGTLRIKADKVVANYKDGQLINATATGNLARFKSRPDGKPDDVEGMGKKIFVNQQKNTLTLTSNALLKQGTNTARGQEIVYNMANDTLKIKGGSKLGAGGNTGKTRPNRKLEDPFKDDPAPTAATPNHQAKSATSKPQTKAEEELTTPTTPVQTAPSGRSRLIIQPKPKTDD